MDKYNVGALCGILGALQSLATALELKRKECGEIPLPEELRTGLSSGLAAAFETCAEIAFIDCYSAIQHTSDCIAPSGTTVGMAQSELNHAIHQIRKELEKWSFVPIAPEYCSYFEKPDLFGGDVARAFPDAREDLREAGNCIAVVLPTAAVFHLMRVAEQGLRVLAKALRVRLTHGGHLHPIEYADWEKVITGIKNKIAKARSLPVGPKRQEKLERYSDAADHCLFMKDIWRNNVAHARKPYIPVEALGVFNRVKDFMNCLALQVKSRP
jgi:hypothetical protein